MTEPTADSRLPSWNDGPTKQAIVEFIAAADELPVEQRVAVFDNDGTLWCEKPGYIQLMFMLSELRSAVADDPSLADRTEFKALIDNDTAKQAELGLPAIASALVELCAGISPEEFERRVTAFTEVARHPTLDVPVRRLRYRPMLELLDELRAHDFTVSIVTGGGTEFLRPISNDFYGVNPELVVGSMIAYDVGRDDHDRPTLTRTKQLFGPMDEGDAKVSNLRTGLGRHPIFAAGNSPGDLEMLEYVRTVDGPSLAVLVNHDDGDREFAYEGKAATFATKGAFSEVGCRLGWTVVSMRDDWTRIFTTS